MIVMGLASVGVFILPLVASWGVAFSLGLGRMLYWVHSIALGDFLPNVIVGAVMGSTAACFIRNQKLWIASSPALLLCVFYGLYYSFNANPYPWGSWYDFVVIGSWLVLVSAAVFCAQVILKRRQRGNSSQSPTVFAPIP
jgi:hypothetical protein